MKSGDLVRIHFDSKNPLPTSPCALVIAVHVTDPSQKITYVDLLWNDGVYDEWYPIYDLNTVRVINERG